ncbi:MAG: methyltransferase [Planctomycetota bacterium]
MGVAILSLTVAKGQWFPSETRVHEIFDWLGAALVVVGGALRLWAGLHIRLWKGKRIVESGPYAYCRHPLYLGSLLALLGLCVIAQNTVFVCGTLVLCVGGYAVKVVVEERSLSLRFGSAWDAYRASTPLLVPYLQFTHESDGNSWTQWRCALSELPGAVMFLAVALVLELLEMPA